MRVLEVTGDGGLDNLKINDRPVPKPGPGEVLIKVSALALNRRDYTMIHLGASAPKTPFPLMSDACGVVEAVGEGVTNTKPGERVTSLFFQRWSDGPVTRENRWSTLGVGFPGVGSEYALLTETGFYPAPASLSDEEAATLPCAALTAWRAMFEDAQLQPGAKVLIQGTGGVSIFGLQFAAAMGLEAIVTSSSDEKLEQAKALGARHVVNYREHPKWSAEVMKLTDKLGVDFVLGVGGGDNIAQSLEALALSGHIAVVGNLAGSDGPLPTALMLGKNARVQGVSVGSRAMHARMAAAVEKHKIKPVIYKTYAFDDAHEAFRSMKSGEHFGKIVLKM